MAKRKEAPRKETPRDAADDDIFAQLGDSADDDAFREFEDPAPTGRDKKKKRGPTPGGSTYGAPATALLPPPDRVPFGRVLGTLLGGLIGSLVIGGLLVGGLRAAGVIAPVSAADAAAATAEAAIALTPDAPASLSAGAAVPTNEAPVIAAAPTEVPTSGPTNTPDPGCTLGIAWWDVAARDNWNFIAGAARTELLAGLGPDQLNATLEALRLRRQQLDSIFTPPCYVPARDSLIRAAEAAIAAVQALIDGDTAASQASSGTVSGELGLVLIALWEQGTVTAPDAPTALNVPRGGGETCSPMDWYTAAEPNLLTFNTAIAEYVATAGAPLGQQLQIGTIDATAGNFAALPAGSPCTAALNTAAGSFMTQMAAGLRQFTAGQTSEGRALVAGAWTQKTVFDAWLSWLNLRVL